jgi:rRNA maturation endonuclease Nob1
MGKHDGWTALGMLILGYLLLKALFDPETKIYRCPTCNLVIDKNRYTCPRCGTHLSW